jgi:hypothetical protein
MAAISLLCTSTLVILLRIVVRVKGEYQGWGIDHNPRIVVLSRHPRRGIGQVPAHNDDKRALP